MRNLYPYLICCLIVFSTFLQCVTAQDLSGTWQGRMQFMKFDIRIVFRLYKDSTGNWHGTTESPDQSSKKFDIDQLEVLGDSISFEIFDMNASFQGRYNSDSSAIMGKLSQRGFKLPLKLLKGDADDLLYNRPQRPRPPFPYTCEEVRIIQRVSGDTLAGTFTKPNGPGKFPAIILISGSGAQDRDESVFGHKPFLLLADFLTRRGYAVLRCDDRGTGASTGNFSTATTADFALDAEAQVAFLRHRKDIQRNRIGLLGHSEGGIIAPMVAAKDAKIAFVILLAAPAIDMFDLLLAQDSLVSKSEGMKRKDMTELIETNTHLFNILKETKDTAGLQQKIVDYLVSINASDAEIEVAIQQLCTPWMEWYVGFDPAKNIARVKCPVLALNGEKDVQVPAMINIPVIESILVSSGNRNHEVSILPGLNHLFQPCKKCSVAEYKLIDQTMDPSVLEKIGVWMDRNVRRP